MNKTSISSVVCLDIIDLAKKSKAEQQKIKKQFHTLLDLAVLDIPEKDRMIVGYRAWCHCCMQRVIGERIGRRAFYCTYDS